MWNKQKLIKVHNSNDFQWMMKQIKNDQVLLNSSKKGYANLKYFIQKRLLLIDKVNLNWDDFEEWLYDTEKLVDTLDDDYVDDELFYYGKNDLIKCFGEEYLNV